MRLDRLLVPIFTLGFIALLLLPVWLEVTMPEPCNEIQKRTVWVEGGKEHVWTIQGEDYLVKESPGGYMEIIGLYERFK